MKKAESKIITKVAIILFIIELLLFIGPVHNSAYAVSSINGHTYDTFQNNLLKSRNNVDETYYKERKLTSDVKVDSIEEASNYLREQMVLRKSVISIEVSMNGINGADYYKNVAKEIYNRAVSYDDSYSSDEGDYLKSEFDRYEVGIGYNSKIAIFNFYNTYRSSYEETQQINKEVKNVLDDLDVYDKSDYEKVLAVHDYIVSNVKYDYNCTKYSAYNAIIEKDVVCQGFASLSYKMLKDLGLKTRIITGVNGKTKEGHAWNIVLVDGKWYNLDDTWDENLTASNHGIINYTYFLKSNDDFSDHIRDEEFNNTKFNNEYPIAEESYDFNSNSNSNSNSPGNVIIIMPYYQVEDVNQDGEVDTEDLAQIGSRYNINQNDENWNSRYDIVKDGIIDLYDIVKVSVKL